ncbi:MAG: hypothetical protein HYV63_04425 [Candidatus Schekmanbacteria bacterium]|nr:hypothetical protein [Candidatus Schekmanbacteria bacterium]
MTDRTGAHGAISRHDMRIALFTTDSAWTLRSLVEAGFRVCLLIRPIAYGAGGASDRKRRRPGWLLRCAGRVRLWTHSYDNLDGAAFRYRIPIVWCSRADNWRLFRRLRKVRPHLLVAAGFPLILPSSVLDLASFGGVNVHASLLPQLRGPQPTAWTIYMGMTETGVTVHRMAATPDTGAILAQRPVPRFAYDDVASLSMRQFQAGAELLVEVIDQIRRGTAQAQEQDPNAGSHRPRMGEAEGHIDWQRSEAAILAHARLAGWLPLHTRSAGVSLRLERVRARGDRLLLRDGRKATLVTMPGSPLPPGGEVGSRPAAGTILAWYRDHALVSTADGAVWVGGLRPRHGWLRRLWWRLRGSSTLLPPGSRLESSTPSQAAPGTSVPREDHAESEATGGADGHEPR